jgi:hypothetical protein
MFFDNWFGLLRVLVVGTPAYAALVVAAWYVSPFKGR